MARQRSQQEWPLLALLGLILLVSITGFLTISDPASDEEALSGHVVAAGACRSCPAIDAPVCAARDGWVSDYGNDCLALCEGARVLAAGSCAGIPRVGN